MLLFTQLRVNETQVRELLEKTGLLCVYRSDTDKMWYKKDDYIKGEHRVWSLRAIVIPGTQESRKGMSRVSRNR